MPDSFITFAHFGISDLINAADLSWTGAIALLWRISPTRVFDFAAYIPLYAACESPSIISAYDVSEKPIRQFHGGPDDVLTIAPCKVIYERLHTAGKDATLTELPGVAPFRQPHGTYPIHAREDPDYALLRREGEVTKYARQRRHGTALHLKRRVRRDGDSRWLRRGGYACHTRGCYGYLAECLQTQVIDLSCATAVPDKGDPPYGATNYRQQVRFGSYRE